MYREVALAWAEFYRNYRLTFGDDHEKLSLELQLKLKLLKAQATEAQREKELDESRRAKRIMKRVAARMMQRNVVLTFITIRKNYRSAATLKRIKGRISMRAVSDCVCEWRDRYKRETAAAREAH